MSAFTTDEVPYTITIDWTRYRRRIYFEPVKRSEYSSVPTTSMGVCCGSMSAQADVRVATHLLGCSMEQFSYQLKTRLTAGFLYTFLLDYFVDEAVLNSFWRGHKVIAIRIFFNNSQFFARMFGKDCV